MNTRILTYENSAWAVFIVPERGELEIHPKPEAIGAHAGERLLRMRSKRAWAYFVEGDPYRILRFYDPDGILPRGFRAQLRKMGTGLFVPPVAA